MNNPIWRTILGIVLIITGLTIGFFLLGLVKEIGGSFSIKDFIYFLGPVAFILSGILFITWRKGKTNATI